MSEFISPIAFDKSFLTSIDFDLKEAFAHFNEPPQLANLSHDLEVSHSIDYEEIEGTIVCNCMLAVQWRVKAPNASEEYFPLFQANAEIVGWARCQVADYEVEEVKEALAASNVSFLWAKLRDTFELLTGASIVGRILLPAISPYALLESNDGNE